MTGHHISRCRPLLGTFVEVNLKAPLDEVELIGWSNTIFEEIARIEQALSFHQLESELSQLNIALLTQQHQPVRLSNDLKTVLHFAGELHALSQGLYDITIAAQLIKNKQLPCQLESFFPKNLTTLGNYGDLHFSADTVSTSKPVCIDLGGIAKGYAVDKAIEKLPSNVIASVNAGGDMRLTHWHKQKVSVKYSKRNSALKKVKMRNCALATSATYYQQHGSQFINPITKAQVPVNGSISVFAATVMHADALTKVSLLMKKSKCQKVLKHFSAKALFINRFGFSRTLT